MGTPLILLALIVGIPLVLTVFLRVKPLYVLVSIVCGYFWSELLWYSVLLMLGSTVRISNLDIIIKIVLLLLPFLLTVFLMRKTLSASALPFQSVLLVADSILLATLLLPLLTPSLQSSIYTTNIGNVFRQAHDVLITSILGIHVLVMWFMRPRHGDAHHGKHKKH